jgi:hypothetical protein
VGLVDARDVRVDLIATPSGAASAVTAPTVSESHAMHFKEIWDPSISSAALGETAVAMAAQAGSQDVDLSFGDTAGSAGFEIVPSGGSATVKGNARGTTFSCITINAPCAEQRLKAAWTFALANVIRELASRTVAKAFFACVAFSPSCPVEALVARQG